MPSDRVAVQPASSAGERPSARESGLSARHAGMAVAHDRHLGRWAISLVVAVALAWLVVAVAANPNLDWGVVGEYLFDPSILAGVRNTVIITVLSQVIGIAGGLVLALCRLSANPVLSVFSFGYIWFFRGVPVLVQLIFWYNLGLVFQFLSVTVPFTDVQLYSVPTNDVITPFVAVLLGLGLNEAAYMAEIIRGGLSAVPRGQSEAAASLGMSPFATMRKVVLPQATRIIVPPTTNQLIIMLKISALASVITYQDLLTSATLIYSVNLRTLELLAVASIWYIALTTVCTIGQGLLERRLGRSLATTTSRGRRGLLTRARSRAASTTGQERG